MVGNIIFPLLQRHYLNQMIIREICSIAHSSTQARIHSFVNIAHQKIFLWANHRLPVFLSVWLRLKCEAPFSAVIKYLHVISKGSCCRKSEDGCVAGLLGHAFLTCEKTHSKETAVKYCLFCTSFVFTDQSSCSPNPLAIAKPRHSSASQE